MAATEPGRSQIDDEAQGAALSDRWLPPGTGWSELDAAREDQLRLRAQIAHGLDALATLEAGYIEEDQAHERELIQAQRDGRSAKKDRRTGLEKRDAESSKLKDEVEAGLVVMSEIVTTVIDLCREHETTWLADLRGSLVEAEEHRRESERVAHDARVAHFGVAKLGDWLKLTADDGPFGMQPHPQPQEPPTMWNAKIAAGMLERRHFEQENPMVSHQVSSNVTNEQLTAPWDDGFDDEAEVPDPDDGQPAGDPTGLVQPLDESMIGGQR